MDKRKPQHKAVYISMDSDEWGPECRKIEKCCDGMVEKGWSLLAMAWPDSKNAILVFTRPARTDDAMEDKA